MGAPNTITIAGQTSASGVTGYAAVLNAGPGSTEYGVVTRPIITQTVNVNVVSGSGTPANTFGNVTLVAATTPTTVTTYTVPGGKVFTLLGFVGSGTVNAMFTLTVNAATVMVVRTSAAGQSFDRSFLGAPPSVPAGQVVTLTVVHDVAGVTADFEGTILGSVA